MRISLIQYSPLWEDKEGNKGRLRTLLNQSEPADLLIFPEMSLTGFSMRSDHLNEDLNGDSFNFFSPIAVERKAFVAAGLIEKDSQDYFNTLLVINRKGKLIGKYRKIHPFSYGSENEHYSGGNAPLLLEIDEWSAGLSICYDLRFPELFRRYGKERASLIINIANWPDTRIHHWETLLKARAIENQCYVAAVNRVGKDTRLNYPGRSMIIDPMGNEVLNCENNEGVFTASVELELVNSTRAKFPFLDDIKLV
jgi:predicted amidohydrolase